MHDLICKLEGSDDLFIQAVDVFRSVTPADSLAGQGTAMKGPVTDEVSSDSKESTHLPVGPEINGEANTPGPPQLATQTSVHGFTLSPEDFLGKLLAIREKVSWVKLVKKILELLTLDDAER